MLLGLIWIKDCNWWNWGLLGRKIRKGHLELGWDGGCGTDEDMWGGMVDVGMTRM